MNHYRRHCCSTMVLSELLTKNRKINEGKERKKLVSKQIIKQIFFFLIFFYQFGNARLNKNTTNRLIDKRRAYEMWDREGGNTVFKCVNYVFMCIMVRVWPVSSLCKKTKRERERESE